MPRLPFLLRVPSAGLAFALPLLLSCQTSWAQLPSIGGMISHASTPLSDVELTLYADDGDLTFDQTLDTIIATTASNASGDYSFSNLNAATRYFIFQGAQNVDALTLAESVSELLAPVTETLLVDGFNHQQRVEASFFSTMQATNVTAESILGGQRDLHVAYLSGPAEIVLHANPWGLSNVLQFDQSAGSIGTATVTWDGLDTDTSTLPAAGGLSGIDLTADGGAAFAFLAGIDEAGAGEDLTLRIFSGDNVSTAFAAFPVTNGTALSELFIPFSAFSGTADFTAVDAIQAEFGGTRSSLDAQVGPIHIVGGTHADLRVATPEPIGGLLASLAGLAAVLVQRRQRRSR